MADKEFAVFRMIIGRISRRLSQNKYLRYVLALFAGALLPLAFAPYDLVMFAVLSPAALFYLWRDASSKQAVFLAYAFGLGYFGLGVSWVSVSMVRYGGVPISLAAALTFLFAIVLSSYIALLAYVYKRFFKQVGNTGQALLLLPALWTLVEWLRGWLFGGFPWLNLGYSQTDGPLAGLAPVFGVYGLSFIVALGAGLFYWACVNHKRQRIIALALAVSVTATALVLDQITWTENYQAPFKVTLLQGNVPQDKKWQVEYRQPAIDMYVRWSREHFDSKLIVWPETALPAYYHQAKGLLSDLANEAAEHDSSVLLGLPIMEENDSSRYYNGMILVSREPHQFYYKRHLVPFGEFIPFKSVFGPALQFLNIPMSDFSSGEPGHAIMHADKTAIGMSICYEDAFGEEVIQALPKANLLVNVSNDSWFGDSFAPYQHLQIARMRAMETRRPLLRATNNGISAIMDYKGKITAQTPLFVKTTLSGVVQARSGSTAYVFWGNYPVTLLALAILLYCWLQQRAPKLQDVASETV